MEQQVLTAYAVLLTINAAVFLLCMIQMIKFARFYRNFNRVVSNIQSYLRCVMDEDTQAQGEQSAQEEIGGGEHFSGSDAAGDSGIVELDDEIPDVEILPRRKKACLVWRTSCRWRLRRHVHREERGGFKQRTWGTFFLRRPVIFQFHREKRKSPGGGFPGGLCQAFLKMSQKIF